MKIENERFRLKNSLSLWVKFKKNIIADSFNIKDVWYLEEVFTDDGTIIDKKMILKYLLINTNDKRLLLDEFLSELCISDLIIFLHKNNPLVKKEIEKKLGNLWFIPVSTINKIYNYFWVKFIDIEAEIDLSFWYDENEINSTIKQFILLDNWNILVDEFEWKEVYIPNLWDNKYFLIKEFVSFSLTESWWVDGYIDSFGKVVKIKGQKLKTIDLLSEIEWKKLYVVNKKSKKISNKDLIFTENELIDQLNKYDWFTDNEFDIIIDWKKIIDSNEIELKIQEILWKKI